MERPPVTIADWTRLLRGLGVDDDATTASCGTTLLTAYGAEDRHYHSVWHLGAVLVVVDALADRAGEPDLVRLAAWYHDAVHEPGGPGGDEERSAELARTDLTRLGLAVASVAEIARLVALTTTHDPDPGDSNGAVLCDADLWILGAGADDYDRYCRDVRAEYGQVPDADWRSGRAAVVRHFLDRPAIYSTEPGRRRESAARANLERELSLLTR